MSFEAEFPMGGDPFRAKIEHTSIHDGVRRTLDATILALQFRKAFAHRPPEFWLVCRIEAAFNPPHPDVKAVVGATIGIPCCMVHAMEYVPPVVPE